MTTAKKARRLASDLKTVVRDAEDLLDATRDFTGSKIGEARNRLTAVTDSVKTTYRNLEGKTVATAKATDRCIRAHPYETIGVFFGLGLLLGRYVNRN
jgi:ElaB/YqjD/DUF883 family membrane-anchored ribosome-binding protein